MSQSTTPAVYPPVERTMEFGGMEFTVPNRTAYDRLTNYVTDVCGYDEEGRWDLAKITDPLLLDVVIILKQAALAIGAVEAAAVGAYASCEHDVKYAGGNVSEGNKIFTPQEGAAGVLKKILELDSK